MWLHDIIVFRPRTQPSRKSEKGFHPPNIGVLHGIHSLSSDLEQTHVYCFVWRAVSIAVNSANLGWQIKERRPLNIFRYFLRQGFQMFISFLHQSTEWWDSLITVWERWTRARTVAAWLCHSCTGAPLITPANGSWTCLLIWVSFNISLWKKNSSFWLLHVSL